MTGNWKTGLTLAVTGKIYFRILGLGLGLDTSGLVNIPAYRSSSNEQLRCSVDLIAFERSWQTTDMCTSHRHIWVTDVLQRPWFLLYLHSFAVFGFQLQCCGITGYNDYNVDIWNTKTDIWQGRNPDVLAPLTCCVQNDESNVYPPTVNDLSSTCLYNGTVPSDYYQPVSRPTYCEL